MSDATRRGASDIALAETHDYSRDIKQIWQIQTSPSTEMPISSNLAILFYVPSPLYRLKDNRPINIYCWRKSRV